MLFDLFNMDRSREYTFWVKRVYQVASILNMDYFQLWKLPEVEFEILEKRAQEIVEEGERKMRQLQDKG